MKSDTELLAEAAEVIVALDAIAYGKRTWLDRSGGQPPKMVKQVREVMKAHRAGIERVKAWRQARVTG